MDAKKETFNASVDDQLTGNKTETPQKNDLLSFCIPTYNHAEPLRKNLESLIPQARQYNIPIYVSDNASTDHTIKVLESFQKDYPLLYFKSNKENLGVDQNMVNAVRMASTKYVWTFGARRILLPGMLNRIYKMLNESDWDLIVLNDLDTSFMVPESKEYNSAGEVFRELNRNLTGLGFQILPSEAWTTESILKYAGTEWTIFGVALEFLANKKNVKVFFMPEPCATSTGPSHWTPRCFQIWASWKKVIYSLPKIYSDDDKEFVLKKSINYFLGPKYNLTFNLINLRINHIYNVDVFNAYRQDFTHYGDISPAVASIIARCPVLLLKLYFKLYNVLRETARIFVHVKVPLNPTKRRGRIPYV
jgi:glycosyltransferase involved in cell wall biosynthesis